MVMLRRTERFGKVTLVNDRRISGAESSNELLLDPHAVHKELPSHGVCWIVHYGHFPRQSTVLWITLRTYSTELSTGSDSGVIRPIARGLWLLYFRLRAR